jgi:predicted helicase
MDMHLNYEQAKRYRLDEVENKDEPFSWRVEKMRLSADKSMLVVNKSLSLGPLPPTCFEYRLGNRSALEWVIDQYQVSKDQRSGIESDPNSWSEEESYIVHLVERVVTVSVETVKLVHELAEAVTLEDWMDVDDSINTIDYVQRGNDND